jgi:uncharacterized protein (TIGR00297 family)
MIDAFIIGFLISLIVTLIAYYKESLNTSGAFTALITGTLIYGFGGWFAFTGLMLFFIPASVVPFSDHETKGRNARQVLGKSFIALYFAVLYFFLDDSVWLLFMITSLSGAAADTWSSLIGKRFGVNPRILPTFRAVKKGTPGGVSLYGILASLVVSFFFGLYHYAVFGELGSILLIAGIGILTALFDSLFNTLRQSQDPVNRSRRFYFFDSEFMNFLSNALAMLVLAGIIWFI